MELSIMSVFGFSTEPAAGGDFTPIGKYDARAGRFFRVDRVDNGNGFVNDPVDITSSFKALFDFENVEVGWIDFNPNSPPDFQLVPMGSALPERPSPRHKNGVRFLIKLAKECGGTKPVREVAGTSKAFLSGVEAVYNDYKAAKAANPGKLPVIVLEKTTPIKSGSGEKTSTNYRPDFKIVGWAPRGDFKFEPKAKAAAPSIQTAPTPPSTGSTKVEPPKPAPAMATAGEDDFG
jgi:hypothetical protein